MNLDEKDKGVIAVLLKRFETERYPRAQEIKSRIDDGGVLDELDLAFLEEVLTDAKQVMGLVARHPEYAALSKGIIQMYEEIMTKSQQNSGQI